jgi:hypothetical protein
MLELLTLTPSIDQSQPRILSEPWMSLARKAFGCGNDCDTGILIITRIQAVKSQLEPIDNHLIANLTIVSNTSKWKRLYCIALLFAMRVWPFAERKVNA